MSLQDATSVHLATRGEGPFRLQLERSPSSRLTNEYEYRVRPKSKRVNKVKLMEKRKRRTKRWDYGVQEVRRERKEDG